MILVRDAEVLEGISKGTAQYPHALPKHGALNLLKAITGHQSIFTLEVGGTIFPVDRDAYQPCPNIF